MPRNKRTFIGPLLPKNPPKVKIPKEPKPKKIKVKPDNPEFYILARYMTRSTRHDSLRDTPDKNSVAIHDLQREWLKRHARVLGEFQRLLNQQELERQKELARKGGHTRRLRILENGSSYYSVIQVLTTYGKNCHICNHPIDLKASRRVGIGNWLLGLHIDHLIPIAKGGPDTLENVRPSHAICNLKKGAS